MIYIGVDPGLDGALAAVNEKGKLVVVHDAPTLTVKKGKSKRRHYVESEMVLLLRAIVDDADGDVHAAIENVHSMPGQGVRSMFSMGQGFGLWLGIIAAVGVSYEKLEPRVWKKEMGLATGSDKNSAILLARRLFPSAPLARKKDDGRADAILIAETLRRRTGKP